MSNLSCLPDLVPDRDDHLAQEVPHPLSPTRPIWIRATAVGRGCRVPPYAVQPVWHPYFEVSITHRGRKRQHVGCQNLDCREGDVLLMGPGTPHYAVNLSEPHRSTAVFFLPRLLLEMGPDGDGARLLARCCSAGNISGQVLRPPPALRARLGELFDAMAREFEDAKEGAELRLRCLLIEILVNIARWKATKGDPGTVDQHPANWMQLQKPLRFVHERYAEPIYVTDLVSASGLSVTRLQQLFRDTVGLSCMQYIQWYRLTRAMALLSAPDVRITEVANEVGFETLSHFNASFRTLVGVSPSDYIRKQLKPRVFDSKLGSSCLSVRTKSTYCRNPVDFRAAGAGVRLASWRATTVSRPCLKTAADRRSRSLTIAAQPS